jgi:hypothetical protein
MSIQDLLNSNLKFLSERQQCIQEYRDHIGKNQKLAEDIQDKKHTSSFTKDKPLTYEELIENGKDINIQYHKVKKNKKKNNFDDYGVPMDVFNYAHDYYNNTRTVCYDDSKSEQDKKLKFTDDAGENAKITYNYLIDKLKEMKIDVYNVHMNLHQYQDRKASSICGGSLVFEFYCKKNNYEFVLDYDDDCDCFPGLLCVKNLLNKETGENYEVHCDLLCGNTGESIFTGFMELLDCKSKTEFYGNRLIRSNKFLGILETNGFKIIETTIKKTKQDNIYIHLEYHETAIIETDNKQSYIQISGKNNGFKFTVGPVYETAEDKKLSYHNKYYDVYLKNAFKFMYKNADSNVKLIKCIQDNINYNNKTFGYLDKSGQWKNELTITKFLKPFKNILARNSMSITYHHNNNIGTEYYNTEDFDDSKPEIDTRIYITIGRDHDPLTNKFPKQSIDYPVEFYNIRFYYDKKVDDKCHMTINGMYHRLSFIQDYYIDRAKFIETYKTRSKLDIGKYESEGDFDTVFGELKTFIQSIVDTNNVKES